MTIPFWLKDPTILFKDIMELWPTSSMKMEEKLNAITRLVILLIFIGLIITQNLNILWLGIITIIIIILLYYNNTKENFENIESDVENYYTTNKHLYQVPRKNNPLMNIVLPEIHYEPKRKPAAPSYLPEVSNAIDNNVKEFVSQQFKDPSIKTKLFSNLGDEFNFTKSMIQYNTMPNTQIPSDQKGFLQYLYGGMISGKEGDPIALYRNNSGSYNYTNP